MQKERMYEKLMNYSRFIAKEGANKTIPRGFVLNYSNACNFHCKHCFTRSSLHDGNDVRLSLKAIADLADQADKLGVYEIDIQGGEPLLQDDLFAVIQALKPERFYLYCTSNGYLMTKDYAIRLAAAGVDRVSISIDAFSPEEHDSFRGVDGAYKRAIDALKYVKDAGMSAYVNIVVGEYNAYSQELDNFCSYARSQGWGLVFNMATPTGAWRGNFDIMLKPKGTEKVMQVGRKHKKVIRDLWDCSSSKSIRISGCPAVNLFYVTPHGDILPCPYIHTSLGNIHKQSLAEITD